MTISDAGRDYTRPPIPTVEESQAQAAQTFSKANLKLVPDTLDLSLLEMDYDARRYQSTASRPLLPGALYSLRMAHGTWGEAAPGESWRSSYDAMLALMPEEFRAAFDAEMRLPPNQRSPNFVVFDQALRETAKYFTWLGIAAGAPVDVESLTAMRADITLVLTFVVLNSLIHQGDSLLEGAYAFLETVGPNHPNFDQLTKYLADYADILNDIKSAIGLLKNTETADEGLALFASTSGRLETLSEEFDRLYAGNDLLMLRTQLHALLIITAAMSLDQSGNAALLLGIWLATLSPDTSVSAIGLFGPSLSNLIDSISAGVLASVLTNADIGSRTYMRELLEAVLVGFMIFGIIVYGNAYGPSDTDVRTPEWLSYQNFGVGLVLMLFTHSNTISSIADVIARGISKNDDYRETIKEILKMINILILILTASASSNPSTATALLRAMGSEVRDGITYVALVINKALDDGRISGETAEQLAIYLEEEKIALDNEDYETFIALLEDSLALIDISLRDVYNDIRSFKETVSTVMVSVENSNEDNIQAGISHTV